MAQTATTVSTHRQRWEARLRAFEEEQHTLRWVDVARSIVANRLLFTGLLVGVALLAMAVLGPVLSPYHYSTQVLANANQPPLSEGHLLGTDHLGRDLAIRVFVGLRISFSVAVGVTAIALIVGLVIGIVGGYLGGWTEKAVRGLTDFLWGFPLILVAVLLAGAMGEGLFPVILAVGVINLAAIARVVRGEVLTLKGNEFVEAARAAGVSAFRIMWRHLLPNIVGPTLVLASYYVAVAIVSEAALSFIGLGAQPPLPSLGRMVAEGRGYMAINHWSSTIPGVVVALLVLSVSLIGDGMRDAFDPRLRHEAKGAERT